MISLYCYKRCRLVALVGFATFSLCLHVGLSFIFVKNLYARAVVLKDVLIVFWQKRTCQCRDSNKRPQILEKCVWVCLV